MLVHPLPDPVSVFHRPPSRTLVRPHVSLWLHSFIVLGRIRLKQPHIEREGWKKSDLDDMLFYGVLGVIIGGRLGEVFFYNPSYFLSHPIQIFEVWHGGMSYHGGFIGVIIAAAIWCYKRKRNMVQTLDFIAPLIPLAYAAGRIGNFINGELPAASPTHLCPGP